MQESKIQEYHSEHASLLKNKIKNQTPVNYQESVHQNLISVSDRSDWAIWLFERSKELGLSSRGIQLSIAYFDHYLSKQFCPVADVELLALSCLDLAYAYECCKELSLGQLSIFSAGNVSYEHFREFKFKLLASLNFNLCLITASEVICYMYEIVDEDFIFHRASMLADLCSLDYAIVRKGILPCALACCFITIQELGLDEINEEVMGIAYEMLGVGYDDIVDTVEMIKKMNCYHSREMSLVSFSATNN